MESQYRAQAKKFQEKYQEAKRKLGIATSEVSMLKRENVALKRKVKELKEELEND